jgi:NADPH:quinone reductase-like Zn-dependent oxidoreductase
VVVWHTRALLLLLLLQALMEAQPVEGQRALVFAASGGVGHVAVQLAKSLGLTTVGVAGPKNTVRGAQRHGMHRPYASLARLRQSRVGRVSTAYYA